MFILSLKSFKGKLLLLIAVVVAAVIALTIISDNKPSAENSADADSTLNYSAATEEELMSFISQTAYTVRTEPVSVTEIIIPEEFDEVYTQYNEIQKKNGFDLSYYSGCTVKKWTYTVTNYPGYENSDAVRLTILVYRDKVIGGDVCSVELAGFMHEIF